MRFLLGLGRTLGRSDRRGFRRGLLIVEKNRGEVPPHVPFQVAGPHPAQTRPAFTCAPPQPCVPTLSLWPAGGPRACLPVLRAGSGSCMRSTALRDRPDPEPRPDLFRQTNPSARRRPGPTAEERVRSPP